MYYLPILFAKITVICISVRAKPLVINSKSLINEWFNELNKLNHSLYYLQSDKFKED